ncbi:hypothetical protein L1887_29853 [Cichorium endivia]|nr:hypothetical protein L1887_29853 [Cichorium endivia]
MITDIKQKFRCQVSIGQCRRAKKWAKDLIEGKLAEHYARIWDYSNELLRSNPGSTCQVGVTCNPDGKNYFHKFYICFKALSNGWKRGCRRVIGLDGCFLKGEVKGELLTAIGRDANNQVYPIAWAVVNVENKPNWTWFLELLNDDLTLDGGRGLVIISDQHKGLLEAVKDILPHVEHSCFEKNESVWEVYEVLSMVNDDSQVEFHEGDPSDVLPDKIQVNEEDLALLLEAGYTMAELEASRGLQMPLDDMPAVEMDLDDGEGHPDEDFNQEEDGEEHPNKEADPDNEGVKNLPKMKRKASERILKMKLKKVVYDADGGGSNSTTPVILE